MFDTHSHTNNSLDSTQSIDDLCQSAIKKGLNAITVTDHADMEDFFEANTIARIEHSLKDTEYAQNKYKALKIYKGVELSGYYHSPQKADEFLKSLDFDLIIGSVHYAKTKEVDTFYSLLDFTGFSDTEIYSFLKEYFKNMKIMAEKMDFDILAHLSCPLRYLNGKYNKNMTLDDFEKEIEEILSLIIERGIALEVNTSGLSGFYKELMPKRHIIEKYFDMGGRFITIGSDSHSPETVGGGFLEAKSLLKEIGFENYCYYIKREKQFVRL